MKYMEQFENKTSKVHLEFSGRAPIKVLDPPVGGSYRHSTQDEDWRLQFKMWKYLQKKHYGWIPRMALIVPACQPGWEEMENLRGNLRKFEWRI